MAGSSTFSTAVCLGTTRNGRSLYTSRQVLPIMHSIRRANTSYQIIAKQTEQPHVPKIALLTIWFGANDACIPPSPQHVPIPKFKDNLTYFVRLIKSPSSEYYSPKTRIILFTPPPINTYLRSADLATREPPLALDRNFEVTKAYAEAVQEVGKNEGVPVLDVWTALYEAADRDEKQLDKFSYDGLHLNTVGYMASEQIARPCVSRVKLADFRWYLICSLRKSNRNSLNCIMTTLQRFLPRTS